MTLETSLPGMVRRFWRWSREDGFGVLRRFGSGLKQLSDGWEFWEDGFRAEHSAGWFGGSRGMGSEAKAGLGVLGELTQEAKVVWGWFGGFWGC